MAFISGIVCSSSALLCGSAASGSGSVSSPKIVGSLTGLPKFKLGDGLPG